MRVSNAISAQTYNEEHAPRPLVAALPEMVVSSEQYERRMNEIRAFVREQMVDGVDYGVIPRTPKPTLFKPGAEKLLAVFGLATRYETTHRIENLFDKMPFILYEVKVIVECKRSQTAIAEGLGACNSRERKYASQDVANIANTVLKMAKKRALIDATLLATRTSGLFQSGDTDETNNSAAPDADAAPRPPLRSVPPETATLEQIAAANEWRKRAVKEGYRTATGDAPKPIAEGETLKNVRARYNKWKAFVEASRSRAVAEEIGEPNLEAEDFGPQTITDKPDKHGPKYQIPNHQPHHTCTACSAEIAFARTESGKVMPIDTVGDNRGYSHYATCSDPDKFRRQREARPKPKSAAIDAEAGYAAAAPTQVGLPKHIKHLWAVAGANGLKAEPRDERIDRANQVLMDHKIDAVESWTQLSETAANCLATAIETGLLTWGEPNPKLPRETDAA